MSQVKLPYYPKIVATGQINLLGLQDISTPEIYETPLQEKTILRIDMLRSLKFLDINDFEYRNNFYELFAHEEDSVKASRLFRGLYDINEEFRDIVREVDLYTEQTLPLITRLRDYFKKELQIGESVFVKEFAAKYKELTRTNGYAYFAAPGTITDNTYGVKIIC